MSHRRLKIILPFSILAAGGIGAAVMIKARPPVATRPSEEFAPLVRVVEVRSKDLQLTVRTHGTVIPRTETALVSEVSGRVVGISSSFAAGGFFERGEVLLTIDPRDYELAVVRARGQVAQARVRAETEEAQARVAREEWAELGEGEGSPLARRVLQVEEARAALASAQAALEQAERDLARTRLRAPFAGRVREKEADLGQFVTRGAPVARVYAVDYVEVRLPIPDSELAYLDLPINYRGGGGRKEGPEVHLNADFAGERHKWEGRIVRVEGEIDPASRMVHAVGQVDDPYGRGDEEDRPPLAVGLFVEAEILGRLVAGAIVVPRSAVRRGGRVLVVDEEDRIRFRKVEILRHDRDAVVVRSGLLSGERVCLSLLEAVTDGMKVRTIGAEEAASMPPGGGP